MDVLCFGEILFDIIEGKAYPGGAPLNFAAHMAKLGARSYILSAVGKDELGERARSEIEKWGLESKFIQNDADHPTGTVDVKLTEGIPSYEIHADVAFDHIAYEEFIRHYTVAEFDLLYFGTLAQREEESRATLWQLLNGIDFPEVFFDINLRQEFYTHEIVHVSLQKASILKINDEEIEVLSEMLYQKQMTVEDFCRETSADFLIRLVIVTMGGEGCYVYENAKLHKIPGISVKVKDTVGAGDAFSAAFMYFYHLTGDAINAAERANILGGYVASCRGPVPDYTDELMEKLFDGVDVPDKS